MSTTEIAENPNDGLRQRYYEKVASLGYEGDDDMELLSRYPLDNSPLSYKSWRMTTITIPSASSSRTCSRTRTR